MAQRGYTVPVLLDRDGQAADAFGVHATPTVFLIGRDRMILGSAIGPRSWDRPEARALLTALLEATPVPAR